MSNNSSNSSSKKKKSFAQQEYDERIAQLQRVLPHRAFAADEERPPEAVHQDAPIQAWDTFVRTYTPMKTIDGKLVEQPPVQEVVIAVQTEGRLYEYTWPVGTIEPTEDAQALADAMDQEDQALAAALAAGREALEQHQHQHQPPPAAEGKAGAEAAPEAEAEAEAAPKRGAGGKFAKGGE
jgi:hypothetical protein